jgi:glycerol-1-phosphate dehydrogenase [NAD(P)+]
LFSGVKIHRAAVCPEVIVCDIDILKTAPYEMILSGVGDVLGKYIAKVDWIIGSIVNDEPYCEVCGQIVTDAVNRLVDHVDDIRARTDEGIRILIEALLLAGMTIMIVGHTRAVASMEHNIVHYWDMA